VFVKKIHNSSGNEKKEQNAEIGRAYRGIQRHLQSSQSPSPCSAAFAGGFCHPSAILELCRKNSKNSASLRSLVLLGNDKTSQVIFYHYITGTLLCNILTF
jgi:hypothetical protein